MRSIYVSVSLVALAALASTLPALGEATEKKSPVPAEAAQAEASKLVKEVYADEWAAAKIAAQKQALAKKLLEKAYESADDPTSQFVLLRLTRDIATQAADGRTAFRAIDKMAEKFQVDALAMKAAVLDKLVSLAQTPVEHRSIADEALKLLDEAVSQDNLTIADQLSKLALDEARKAREKNLLAQAQGRATEIAELLDTGTEVKAARATLEKAPDDAQANLVMGKYLCFVKRDWEKGLPMLALGKDEALKAVAMQEIQGVASSTEQAKLGDGWWDLAEKQERAAKKAMRARAAHWYQSALPGLSGLMKEKATKRLQEPDGGSGEWWRGWKLKGTKVVDGALRLEGDASILSPVLYSGALDIRLTARTNGTNIRLVYGDSQASGNAMVVWSCANRRDELRVQRFDGAIKTAKMTPLQPNKWHNLRWLVRNDAMYVYVNYRLVFVDKQVNALSKELPVMLLSSNAVVDVKALEITRVGSQ